ncbi:phage tail assembly chaperone GT [Sutcliffiella horikoshii]|uniref:phage tail assembly chaperone GT n=1 Tax=Sutcliffiella horikoshii TaxID=79883 RepID=UPI003CF874D2
MSDEDFSSSKQKEYMDRLILQMMKSGKDINEILNMPFHFMVELMREENKPKQVRSLFAAFGG